MQLRRCADPWGPRGRKGGKGPINMPLQLTLCSLVQTFLVVLSL